MPPGLVTPFHEASASARRAKGYRGRLVSLPRLLAEAGVLWVKAGGI